MLGWDGVVVGDRSVCDSACMGEGLPAGTVTFLFSDVESSTRLLQELGEAAYATALAEHRRAIEEVCARQRGWVVDREGDACFVAFASAHDALVAAWLIQQAFAEGLVRVRIGVHTGTPTVTEGGYVGLDVHRAARIAAAAHGGQVVFSSSARALVHEQRLPERIIDLGEHRLKDLAAVERLFQLGERGFPPLRSLPRTNLPVPGTPFVGRRRELLELADLLRTDTPLVTLTGPGGAGKTRLALQAAAEVAGDYPDGVWWIPLASLREASLALPAVAQTLGILEESGRKVVDALAARLDGRHVLLVFDNVEHLLPEIAAEISSLASRCPLLRILMTSRERLQLAAEVVAPVPPMASEEAVQLFLERARSAGVVLEADAAVAELCARLDDLPLALELAAARTVVFSPKQLLERLTRSLDLFKGGRDADPRQSTLRATIDWSYGLLATAEQQLFAALAVFTDGCSYEAAEAVAGADPDSLQSLLERNLLRRREAASGPRFSMLVTIREYALEKLRERPDEEMLRHRHAEWCHKQALDVLGMPGSRSYRAASTSELDRFRDDYDNARAALEWAWSVGNHVLALELGAALCRFWLGAGHFGDATEWLEAAVPLINATQAATQLHALEAAGLIAFFIRGDSERADELFACAGAVAAQLGLDEEVAWIDHRRASVAWDRGNAETAISTYQRLLAFHRQRGNRLATAGVLHNLGECRRDIGDFEQAEKDLLAADEIFRSFGAAVALANNTHSLADLALDRRDFPAAIERYEKTLAEEQAGDGGRFEAYCLAGIASAYAATGRNEEAARLWGAVSAAEQQLGFRMLPTERRRYEQHLSHLEQDPAWHEGRTLTLQQASASLRPDSTSA